MERTWAIVELMGHSQIVGEISEEEIASAVFLRVDVPENGDIPAFTKFYGSTAIYAITPTDEETARFALSSLQTRPVAQYILPRSLPAPAPEGREPQADEDYVATGFTESWLRREGFNDNQRVDDDDMEDEDPYDGIPF